MRAQTLQHYMTRYVKSHLPLPADPLFCSLPSAEFEPMDVLSRLSCCLGHWEGNGDPAVSALSKCHGGLSAEDFNRSLVASFFGFMNLTKALAPIQWFFLIVAEDIEQEPVMPFTFLAKCITLLTFLAPHPLKKG